MSQFFFWSPKKIGEKNEFFFLPLSVPGPLSLNRLCSNNSAFQVDRGVSEGFSRNWQETGPGEEKVHRLTAIGDTLTAKGDTLGDSSNISNR